MSTFPSMRGDVKTVTTAERTRIWQDVNRDPASPKDIMALTNAWIQSLADLRYALKEKAL